MTGVRVVIGGVSGLRRAAMGRLLEDAGLEVLGQAQGAGDLLRKVRAHRPDVAVVELPEPHCRLGDSPVDDDGPLSGEPGAGSVDVLRAIRGELPGVGVLLISRRVEERHVAALLEGGAEAAGYLLEERVSGVPRFIEAVRQVAARGTVLDPEVVTRLVAPESRDRSTGGLSDREREVLAQMAAGVTNRGIARRMFLSERAIERHVSSIFDTLGIAAARQANRRVLAVLAHLGGAEPA